MMIGTLLILWLLKSVLNGRMSSNIFIIETVSIFNLLDCWSQPQCSEEGSQSVLGGKAARRHVIIPHHPSRSLAIPHGLPSPPIAACHPLSSRMGFCSFSTFFDIFCSPLADVISGHGALCPFYSRLSSEFKDEDGLQLTIPSCPGAFTVTHRSILRPQTPADHPC